jgi:hypothetical protein
MPKASARKLAYNVKYNREYRKRHPGYNAELMAARRKKFGGPNGAGPKGKGKDMSHKGGKLVVESSKANRARAGRKSKKKRDYK